MHEESTPPNVEPTSVDVHGTSPTPPNAPASAERVAIPLKVSRIKRLIWIFGLLFAVLVAPSVAGRIQYALTAAKERAQYDFAREHHK